MKEKTRRSNGSETKFRVNFYSIPNIDTSKNIGIIFPMIIQTRNNASKDKLNLRSEVKNPIAEIFDNSRGYLGIKPS